MHVGILKIIIVTGSRTYQQMEKVYSVCYRRDVLHGDTCTRALCHATLYASSKSQTQQ